MMHGRVLLLVPLLLEVVFGSDVYAYPRFAAVFLRFCGQQR